MSGSAARGFQDSKQVHTCQALLCAPQHTRLPNFGRGGHGEEHRRHHHRRQKQESVYSQRVTGSSLRWFWGEMQSVPKKGRFSPSPAPRTPPAVTPLAPAPRLTTSHQPTQACRLSLVGRPEVVGCRLSVVAATGRRTSVVGCKSQRGADTFRQNGCTTYNVHTRFVGCGSILADATYNVQLTNKNGRNLVGCTLSL